MSEDKSPTLDKSKVPAVAYVMQPCGTDHAIMEDKTGALKGNCDRASGGGSGHLPAEPAGRGQVDG